MLRRFTLLLLFLCLLCPEVSQAANIEKYKSMKPGENIFYGRIWYVREKDLEGKKLGFFETMFVDAWKIDNVIVCLADGGKDEKGEDKELCSYVDAFGSRPRNPGTGKDGLFSVRTGSKWLELRKFMFTAGPYLYEFKLSKPPRLKVSETGRLFYMGDFALGLSPSKGRKDVPKLALRIINNMKQTSDIFAHHSGAAPGIQVKGKSFNVKGAAYKLTVKKRIYKHHITVTPVYRPKR
jgi:hypothetical protein